MLIGITINCIRSTLDPVVCRAVLLCTTCDLPAKAMIMNMVQFNGFYGCSHCLQPGTYMKYMHYTVVCISYLGETHHIAERSYTHIYKYMEANPVGPKRTKGETLNHMKTAFSTNSTVIQLVDLVYQLLKN